MIGVETTMVVFSTTIALNLLQRDRLIEFRVPWFPVENIILHTVKMCLSFVRTVFFWTKLTLSFVRNDQFWSMNKTETHLVLVLKGILDNILGQVLCHRDDVSSTIAFCILIHRLLNLLFQIFQQANFFFIFFRNISLAKLDMFPNCINNIIFGVICVLCN